jgi:hypothetical protein
MQFNRKFGFVFASIVVSLAMPAFAKEKKTVDSGLGTTNSGGTAACPTKIVCIVNGVVVTGAGQEACNGGSVRTITQCDSKAKH